MSTLFQVQEYRNRRYHPLRSLATWASGMQALRSISKANVKAGQVPPPKLRLLTPEGDVWTFNSAGEAVLKRDNRPAAPHVENNRERRTRLGLEQRDRVAAEVGAGLLLKKFFGGNDGPVQ